MNGDLRIPSSEDPASVLAFLEDCRDIHAEWADWLEANPEQARKAEPCEDVAGDAKHHRDCVEGYNQSLELLRRLAGIAPPRKETSA